MTHELKCWPRPFAAVVAGAKHHEIRLNDRNYQVGDVLVLREWNPHARAYTESRAIRLVTYCSYGPDWGLPDRFVVMSLEAPRSEAGAPKAPDASGVGK